MFSVSTSCLATDQYIAWVHWTCTLLSTDLVVIRIFQILYRKDMLTRLLALIILALLPRLSMAAGSAVDSIWVFEDTTASLSFEDVVAMPDAFVQTTDTNIGFSDSAFWIRVAIEFR